VNNTTTNDPYWFAEHMERINDLADEYNQCVRDIQQGKQEAADSWASILHDLVREEDALASRDPDQFGIDFVRAYVGIDLRKPVQVDELGIGCSSIDMLELGRREFDVLKVHRIRPLIQRAFGKFCDAATGRAELEVTYRDIAEAGKANLDSFKRELAEVLLEVFSSEDQLPVEHQGSQNEAEIRSIVLSETKEIFSKVDRLEESVIELAPEVEKGKRYSVSQSLKGKKGADERWKSDEDQE